MDDEIKPLLYCRRPCNPKFHCCLWAARLGPVDKNQTLTQRKLDRALCNIEIWGLGVYLVGVCKVWSFCPSTVSWLYFLLLKSLSAGLPDASVSNTARDHDLKEPWLQSTMMAKQWLQRTMTAKRNDRKERWLQENNDCNKAMTAKNRPLQRAVLEGSLKSCTKASFSHVFTSSCRFWRKSRTKASIAQLQLANFEGNSHECFAFTSSTRRFWRTSRAKAFLCTTSTCRFWSKLARKLRFHIFDSQILKDARAKAFLCTTSTCRFWKGSLARKLDQGDKMRRTTDLSLASQ